MNNKIITDIKKSIIAREGVIFISTDDLPRALVHIKKSIGDKSYTSYCPYRGFYDADNYDADTEIELDTLRKVLTSAGDINEDILILNNIHDEFDNYTIDVINDVSLYGDNSTFIIIIVPFGYDVPREIEHISLYTLPHPDKKEIEACIYQLFNGKERVYNKLDLNVLLDSLVGLPMYTITHFFNYELSEHYSSVSAGGTDYLMSKLYDLRLSTINTIEGLSTIEYDDVEIAGCNHVKEKIQSMKDIALINRKGYNFKKPKGILLHGSAGVGKTQFAKYIAKELNNTLFKLDLGGIYNKWLGVPEERLNTILSFIDDIGNCTVLIDEIHLIFDTESKAEDTTNRLLSMLLTYMSENNKDVVFVFTANDISQLPPAILRKGRIDYIIEVPLPNEEERVSITNLYLGKHNHTLDDLNIFKNKSAGCSGADIEWYVESAIKNAILRGEQLTQQHLIDIVETC